MSTAKLGPDPAGKAFLPDPELLAVATTKRYSFWVGVYPACPPDGVVVGAINFPKVSAKLRRPPDSDTYEHFPYIGGIVPMSRAQFDRVCDRMKYQLIRFAEPRNDKQPMAGSKMEDNRVPSKLEVREMRENGEAMPPGFYKRKAGTEGGPVKIPRPEDIKKAKENGRALPGYMAQPYDEPAARYLFCIPCEDQENPRAGEIYPPSIADTGMVWPGR